MKLVVQRVSEAWVRIGDTETPRIAQGLLALVGFTEGDTEALLVPMARKLIHLRVFGDDDNRMNLSLLDVAGGLVLVPQFTLYADCRKGHRPSFVHALEPIQAKILFDRFVGVCQRHPLHITSGVFGAQMAVYLVNDGPVTLTLESTTLKSL